MLKKLLSIFVLALWMGQAFAQIDPNRTVMKINGEEIKGAEYYLRMEFLPEVGRMLPGGLFESTPPGLLVLQLILEERIILQCAKDHGVFPTEAQVKDYLEQKKLRDPQTFQRMKDQGFSEDFLMYQTRIEQAQFNLITKGVNIADLEVESYYKGNQREFTTPKRVKLRVIAVQETDKSKVDSDLKSGKDFADVAKALSKDLTANKGGDLGEVPVDSFTGPIRDALEAIKIGQTTDWIQGESVFIKFLKENVIPAVIRPLDDPLKKRIRRNLMLDRGAIKNDLQKMLQETRKKVKVEIIQPQFKNEFEKFMSRAGVNR